MVLLASAFNLSFSQSTGIFQTYSTLNYNGTFKYFEGTETGFDPKGAEGLEGQYLGTFSNSDTFVLAGGDIHTFKNGGADVTGAELNYSIYKVGGSSSFTPIVLGFCCNGGGATCIDGIGPCDTGSGAGDQKWYTESAGVNILSGLDPGEYVLEVFFKASTSLGDRFDSDGGNNFKANFTVGTDGFLDADLSTGTVWSGETTSFSVLDPTTLTGDGSNSNLNGVDVVNDQVLVSNANTADAVITTPSTQAFGTWQFSVATGETWDTSASNSLRVILISDESDPAKLKDGSFDFNGYFIEFGQSGSTDYFELVRVEGSTESSVISTSYPATANLFDGYRVKITRDQTGNWEILADQGFDGTAASTSRGTGTDNEIKTSSFFGLTSEITNPNDDKRVYYDNISLSPNTEITFDITSSDNDETDGSLVVNLDIATASLSEATTADIVLVKGDPNRIDSYSTQTVTFPAGSTASIPFTVNITDNDDCDYDTSLLLAIRNISGGLNAEAGQDTTLNINLTDDNTTSENKVNDDLEDGDLVGWTGETTAFTNDATNELSGNNALYTASTEVDGDAYLTLPNPITDINGAVTTWQFSVATGLRDPNDLNRFIVYLTSNTDDLNSTGIQGYAIAVNLGGNTDDRLRLYRVDDASNATGLITYEVAGGWGAFDNFAVQVTRNETGDWELFVNDNVDFNNLQSVGTVNDATYDFMGSVGVVSYKTLADWEVWFDDISVVQEFCSGAYESTGSGNTSAANWQLVGTAVPATPPFNKYTDIIVRNGDTVTLDSDIRTGIVDVETGATLNLGADYEIEIYNDLTIDGELESEKGAVSMIGDGSAQVVSGVATPTFYEFNVENASGVDFNIDAKFYGPIHPEAGTLDFGTQDITLASDFIDTEILTGSISTIKSGADVLGQITMERQTETLGDGFRIIGVPVTNQTIETALNDDFITTGFTGSDFPNHYYTNVYDYDEMVMGVLDDGFIEATSTSNSLDNEKAYIAYFPPETNDYKFDATGDFRKGDITYNLTYTDSSEPDTEDGWHMIPNPYPSAIDIMSTDITFTNCIRGAYVLDNTLGDWQGQYISYVEGVSNNGGDNVLSSYQGFWVKATGPGASITFSEGAKVDDQAGYIRFDDVNREIIRLSINNETSKYETTISFHDEASNGYDGEFDGYYFGNDVLESPLSLASKLDENYYAINTLETLTGSTSIPLRVACPAAGEFTLSVDLLQNIQTSACLTIEDTETGEVISVTEGSELIVNSPSENYITERYILHIKAGAELNSLMTSCYGAEDGSIVYVAPSYAQATVEWFDSDMNLLSSSSETEATLENLSAGNYTMVINSSDEHCSTLTEEIAVVQPGEETITINSTGTFCSDNMAEVSAQVTNTNSWNLELYSGVQLIDEVNSNDEALISDLAGGTYTAVVTTSCNSEEFTLDLADENAVQAAFNAPSITILENGIAVINAVNTSVNAQIYEWYLNGELISQSEDLTLEFFEQGLHNLTLVSSNETCSNEHTVVLAVEIMDSVSELEELEFNITRNGDDLLLESSEVLNNAAITLYDAQGKMVSNSDFDQQSHNVNLSPLGAGLYTIVITDSNSILWTEKIMK